MSPSRFIQDMTSIPEKKTSGPLAAKDRDDFILNIHTRYGGSLSGRKVRHPTFGEGRVVALRGSDGIMVEFEKTGLITLHLKYAPLKIIDE